MTTIVQTEDLRWIIRDLKIAVDVCYTAPDTDGQGYPFATGYSRSAMQSILEKLQTYLKD
jgi:hypothetical protein